MDKTELKEAVLEGIEKLLGLGRLFVNAEQKKVLRAQKEFWESADAPWDKLVECYEK